MIRSLILAMFLLSCVKSHVDGAPVIVDHANCNSIETATAANIAALGKMKVFFAHASVGGNILSGMNELHTQNPGQYPLSCEPAKESPETTKDGSLYEYNRGNPGAEAKISIFAQCIRNGWHSPAVNVVINKFCYIDPDANFDNYIASMSGIEKEYPSTRVVYVTIPITTQKDAENLKRQKFNKRLRNWANQNNKVLFDLADIEAWSPDGKHQTYSLQGNHVEAQCDEYSADGGHLNHQGQLRLAKAMYTLLAQLAARP